MKNNYTNNSNHKEILEILHETRCSKQRRGRKTRMGMAHEKND
ncbi:MAG: hypothetical protein ACO2Y5_02835 [Nitrosopumilaceae archaeon]